MKDSHRLLLTLKRLLKFNGFNYRKIATSLAISEPTVKRLFSNGNVSLDRLTQLAELIDMTLLELMQEVAADAPQLSRLTVQQESELVSDTMLLLVAICILNHWTLQDIVATYRITESECLQRLLQLDRLRLIDVLPGNRVRLNVTRDFDWLPQGPIRQRFRALSLSDFVSGRFTADDETFVFVHGMLSPAAILQFQTKLRRLRQDFSELHQESLTVPLSRRRGTGLLLAMREWEPQEFEALRQKRSAS